MSEAVSAKLRLRLPATSANLGPGFDAAAVALNFYLDVEAEPAAHFSITATGRDAERCGQMRDNLILEVYRQVLAENGRPEIPIAIRMQNAIPLGMGCGSSAAGRLAAIALAVHFGRLGWSSEQILSAAATLEGHPDNAAACWLGGFVAATHTGGKVHVAKVVPPAGWRAIVVLPSKPLATSKARAVLPESYSRADVVANLQAASLLGLAFAQERGDLLGIAMADRIHQPYRSAICPQLPRLLPISGSAGILGVALSGAGPAVLMVIDGDSGLTIAQSSILHALRDLEDTELLVCRFETEGAESCFVSPADRPSYCE